MELTILIVDDHALMRAGLRSLLLSEPDIQVVGEAADGRQALKLALTLKPYLILMDLSMPGTEGTEAIRIIKKRLPLVRVVVLTVHKTEEFVRVALDAGADGYLLKDDTHSDLIAAITSVIQGKTFLSPGITEHVIVGFLNQSKPQKSKSTLDSLTHRERQVIKLIAEGKKNKEIAEYLAVSIKTIEKHRSNLMNKLNDLPFSMGKAV